MLDAHPAPDALARPPLHTVTTDPHAEQVPTHPAGADSLFTAARTLLPVLEAGLPLDAATLRDAMTQAFGATDASGAWVWKDAYEAAEAAAVLFLQRYGRAMRRTAGAGPDGPRLMLAMLEAIAALEPSHTKRSEEQLRLQQFSTPLPLAYAALQAAAIRPGDVMLEPSAGTGMLAVMAECAFGKQAGGSLHLNEIAAARAGLLSGLFPGAAVTTPRPSPTTCPAIDICDQTFGGGGRNIGEGGALEAADLFDRMLAHLDQGRNLDEWPGQTAANDIAGLAEHCHAPYCVHHELGSRLDGLAVVREGLGRLDGSRAVRTGQIGEMNELQTDGAEDWKGFKGNFRSVDEIEKFMKMLRP